jgi:hypothetical protein
LHDAIGLGLFAAALGHVAWSAGGMGRERGATARDGREPLRRERTERAAGAGRPDPGARRGWTADWLIPLAGLMLLGVAVRPLFGDSGRPPAAAGFPGWPATFEGRALAPLESTGREARFAAGFPGKVGAFTDGERTIVLRWVACETRKLHPALHCLRGLGYAVQPGPVWRDSAGRHWGTTLAERDGRRRRVRERISDGAGREWTDVSAWWWDAWRGNSPGPWWAATVFED